MDLDERRAYEGVISRAAEIALSDPNAFIELFVRDEKNRPIVQAQLHRDMQREWTRSHYIVTVVPREHGKTTQALGRVAWEVVRDPNIRVKIVGATDADAADCVVVVRAILEQSAVQEAYPWVRFAPGRPQFRGRFTMTRSATHMRDPTVHGVGIFRGGTGARADLLLFDDPVTYRNALTESARRKGVIGAFFNDYFPMIGPDARVWYIGTPWHERDLTSFLLSGRETEKKPDVFKRAVSDDLVSPWPEFWTRKRLETRKAQWTAGAFARAFFLRPVAEKDAVCQAEWIVYERLPRSDTVVLGIDPARGGQGKLDHTAISVLEIHEGFGLLRDVVRIRAPLPEQVECIMGLRNALRPEIVAVESVGVQGWMADELKKQGCREVAEARPVKDKAARFRLLGLRISQQTLRLSENRTAGLSAFVDELLGFPAAEHDDTLDATMIALKAAEDVRLVEAGPSGAGELDDDEDRGMRLSDYVTIVGGDGRTIVGDSRGDEKDEWAGW